MKFPFTHKETGIQQGEVILITQPGAGRTYVLALMCLPQDLVLFRTIGHCWWECRFSIGKNSMKDSAIVLLDIKSVSWRGICTSMFTGVLCTIAKIWKQHRNSIYRYVENSIETAYMYMENIIMLYIYIIIYIMCVRTYIYIIYNIYIRRNWNVKQWPLRRKISTVLFKRVFKSWFRVCYKDHSFSSLGWMSPIRITVIQGTELYLIHF